MFGIKILNFYLGYVNGQIEVELTVNAFGPPIALGYLHILVKPEMLWVWVNGHIEVEGTVIADCPPTPL